MNWKRGPLAAAIILSLSSLLAMTGCTSLLPGVMIEGDTADFVRIGPNGIDSIREGEHLVIVVDAGDSLSGEFLGKAERPAEEYYEEYLCWRDRLFAETLLPAPGEMVRIQWKLPGNRVIARGVFAGADTGGLYVTMVKRSEVGAAHVPIADVISINDENGRALDVPLISGLVRQGQNSALATMLRGRAELVFNGLNLEEGRGNFTGIDHGYLFFRNSTGTELRVDAALVRELSGKREGNLGGMALNRLLRQEPPPGFKSIVVKTTMDTVLVSLNRIQSIEFYPSWFRKSGMKTIGTAVLVVGGVAAALVIFDLFLIALDE